MKPAKIDFLLRQKYLITIINIAIITILIKLSEQATLKFSSQYRANNGNSTDDKNHGNPKNKFLQYQVGLLNPAIQDGPLSEEDAVRAMEDYFYEPKDKVIGVVTFSENLKNQKLGKLRINSKNMKLYFPTDNDTLPIAGNVFNSTLKDENIIFNRNKEKLFLFSEAEKPENFDINPYKLILDKENNLLDEMRKGEDSKDKNESKEKSDNGGLLSYEDVNDFSKINRNKKNLLQLSVLHEEKIYKQNLDMLKDKFEQYNKHVYNPLMKYNMQNLQTWKQHNINRYDHHSNGNFEEIIDNNNDYYKNN